MSGLFEKVKGQEKTNVNMTIDKSLLLKLEEYKKAHKIKALSPMINEMLWEWIKQEEENNK